MAVNIAVVGATGVVGREMLSILETREFPVKNLYGLASSRSVGKEFSFADRTLKCQDLKNFDFSKVDLCLMSAGGTVSKEFSQKIVAAGAYVIDNSSTWRYHDNVPLVVPEVNPESLASVTRPSIIANPNCSTIQMLVALKPLYDISKIRRLVVSTYQSVSGAGSAAMSSLYDEARASYTAGDVAASYFPKRIAFNVIPEIDKFMEDGYTKEEWKMVAETKKILDPVIRVTATCVRVPVYIGHAVSVNVEFVDPVSVAEARAAIASAPGCKLVDRYERGGYVTPHESVGSDDTYVSRIRADTTITNGLNLWVVTDNLRKGAALNSVQIAEELRKQKILG